MEESDKKEQGKKKSSQFNSFTVPFAFKEIKENITISTNTPSNVSKEQIINQAFKSHSQGNIPEAAKHYQYFISQGFNDPIVFSNYGIILKDLGNLKEAELAQRKAIALKPDFAIAYYNLGNTLSDLGNLEEAELSIRKAIELKPDFAAAQLNLGNILQDLGNLKEAELSTLKAIKLNPNFAEAYSNLAVILRLLGKLQEAESATKIAIQLNPKLCKNIVNSGLISRDRGNTNDSNNAFKSIIKSKLGNTEDRFEALINLAINNLLIGNIVEVIIIFKDLKAISEILNVFKKNKEKRYINAFYRFLSALIPQIENYKGSSNYKKIPHIGESHCLSFSHQNLILLNKSMLIQPILITGAKAWHFASKENNQWKASLQEQINKHTYSEEIFISFGEIDCRTDEGILTYAEKYTKDILEVCQKTIDGYLNHMEAMLSPIYKKRYYFGVPAPEIIKEKTRNYIDIKRIEVTKIYNALLKKEVLSRGSYFLDVYGLTSTEDGENNNLHMCDKYHLSPKCLSILFENHLYKS